MTDVHNKGPSSTLFMELQSLVCMQESCLARTKPKLIGKYMANCNLLPYTPNTVNWCAMWEDVWHQRIGTHYKDGELKSLTCGASTETSSHYARRRDENLKLTAAFRGTQSAGVLKRPPKLRLKVGNRNPVMDSDGFCSRVAEDEPWPSEHSSDPIGMVGFQSESYAHPNRVRCPANLMNLLRRPRNDRLVNDFFYNSIGWKESQSASYIPFIMLC